MSNQKTATATSAVIKAILWSVGATFAILGTIEMLVYSGDSTTYFVIASIFGVIWGLFAAITRTHKKNGYKQEETHAN